MVALEKLDKLNTYLFYYTKFGEENVRFITVWNGGDFPVTIQKFSFIGKEQDLKTLEFVSPSAPLTLQPGLENAQKLVIRFKPTLKRPFTALLSLYSTDHMFDHKDGHFVIRLLYPVRTPYLEIGDQNLLEFPSTRPGISRELVYEIKNIGLAPLEIHKIQFTPEKGEANFRVNNPPTLSNPIRIKEHEKHNIKIRFRSSVKKQETSSGWFIFHTNIEGENESNRIRLKVKGTTL